MEERLESLCEEMKLVRRYIQEAQQTRNAASMRRWVGELKALSRRAEVEISQVVKGMRS